VLPTQPRDSQGGNFIRTQEAVNLNSRFLLACIKKFRNINFNFAKLIKVFFFISMTLYCCSQEGLHGSRLAYLKCQSRNLIVAYSSSKTGLEICIAQATLYFVFKLKGLV
jgi:hypothetical protein